MVNDTTVKGVTGVGGIVGIAIGGSYNYINCNATVEATGSGAGAFAGILYDYYFDNRGYISSEHAKVNEAVFGGSVTAGEQAGAFVGRLTYSSPKKDSNGDVVDFGNDYLDSKNYHRIILTSDVTAKNNIAVWGTFYLDPTEYTDTDPTNLKPTNSLDGDAIRNTGTAPQSVVWGGLKLNGTPLWGEYCKLYRKWKALRGVKAYGEHNGSDKDGRSEGGRTVPVLRNRRSSIRTGSAL